MAIPAPSVSSRADPVATVAIVVTIVAWASAFPAIRAGLAAFGPMELGAVRFAIAAVPAAIFLAVTRPALPARGELWRFGVGGIGFVALYTALLNFGELTVSAGAASFIINVSPILTAIFAVAVLGERFSRLAWAGTLLSFAGIGIIALGEGEGLELRHRRAADPRRGVLHRGQRDRAEAAVCPPQAADRLGLEHGGRRAGACRRSCRPASSRRPLPARKGSGPRSISASFRA